MLPVSVTSTITTPPPIVNTTTPGTNDVHTPPTIVAPSFSSPQADNNARGNNTRVALPEQQPLSTPQAPPSSPAVGVPQSPADKFTLGAQTNFLAQLIGQDITPSVQGVLVQYEKLVNISNVKYKPSDALKPQAQPSSLFGKLLQVENQAEPVAPVPQDIDQPIAESTFASGNIRFTQEPDTINRSAKAHSFAQDLADEEAAQAKQEAASAPVPPRGIKAYLSTASRVSAQSLEDKSSEEPVSHVA